MKGKDKSVMLTSVLVKVVYGLVAVCCVIAPFLVKRYDSLVVASGQESVYFPVLITLYCAVPFAVVALVCLDILIRNIRLEQPFVTQNVTMLRIISYCCFAEVLVFVYLAVLKPFAVVVLIASGFMGLILRVVKNVFEQAIKIREENDFTI